MATCPTCQAVQAVLRAAKVPKPVAKAVSRSGPVRSADRALRTTKAVRSASKYSRKLSVHLKKERSKAMKKNGQFKKGHSMKTVMAKAHKCVKREMKK